jgi:uncharacterized protein
MKRIYNKILKEHFANYQQMAFLQGPRQVGKTTIAKNYKDQVDYFKYLNWDSITDREIILAGYHFITKNIPIDAVLVNKSLIVLDEIHKYKNWKNFIKGFIDEYKDKLNVIVTGSSKLNVFKRGGDSLMGRYFLYQIHPLSVAEMHNINIPNNLISNPVRIDDASFNSLFQFGGFPEPLIKQEIRFYNKWQNLRQEQLLREEIRSLSQVQDLAQIELLAMQLQNQSGQLVNYNNLAKKIRVSDQTIRRWISLLESLYYCFKIPPFSNNVARSLIKEPKLYLWDWSVVKNDGAKIENFVACHLLKAVDFWNNLGFGKFGLYFVRDKDQREVDFLITKDLQPWLLIEVKKSATDSLNKNLYVFKTQLNPQFTFQLAFDLPYIDYDFRDLTEPKIISLKTFLSQLI